MLLLRGRRWTMGRPKKAREPLPPIWRVSDEHWAMTEPILAQHDPPAEFATSTKTEGEPASSG
jgi:hypothetical protein